MCTTDGLGADQQNAFTDLKNALSKTIHHTIFDEAHTSTMTKDAILFGISAILTQKGKVVVVESICLSAPRLGLLKLFMYRTTAHDAARLSEQK